MAAKNVFSPSYDNHLNCLLCLKEYKDPRVIPCDHTFCEKCLGEYIISNVESESDKIVCPTCKEKCDPPNRNITVNQWASSFRINDIIVSLMVLVEVTEKSSNLCFACRSKDQEVNAKIWCPDCREKLCSNCHLYHKRNKVLKSHKTVPIEEMRASENIKLNFDKHCTCDAGYSVDAFCFDHKQMCCVYCSTMRHRQCTEVRDLEDTVKEFTFRTMPKNVMRDAEKMIQNLQEFNDERERNKSSSQANIDKCIKDMNDICDNVKKQINTFQISFRKAAKDLGENLKAKQEKNQENLRRFSINVENTYKIFQLLNQHGNPKQNFIAYNSVISQLNSHYIRLSAELQKEDVLVSLEVNETLQELKDVTSFLGRINDTSAPSISAGNFVRNMNDILKSIEERMHVDSKVCGDQMAKKVDPLTCSITHKTSVRREEVTGVMGAYFTGATCLPNGHLIVGDRTNRLVEFDTSYKMIRQYHLDGYFRDVTSVGPDIYVSVYKGGEWYIYKCRLCLDGGLSMVSMVNAPQNTWGIAVSNDGMLIVTTDDALHVLSQLGEAVHKIARSGSYDYVAVSRSLPAMMYHSDGDTIVCRSLENGQQQYRYSHDNMECLTGICVGHNDVLYFCCRDSGNVHQVSSDGKHGRIILNNLQEITKPRAIVFNEHTSELIITSSSKSENTMIEVYKLQ